MPEPDGPDLPERLQGQYEVERARALALERKLLNEAEIAGPNFRGAARIFGGAGARLDAYFAYLQQALNAFQSGQWTATQTRRNVTTALGPLAGSIETEPRWVEYQTQFEELCKGATTPAEAAADQPEGLPEFEPPKKRRGRPSRFTTEALAAAARLQQQGKSNNEVAKVLYETKAPTPGQRRSVAGILKRHAPESRPLEKIPSKK